MINKFSIPNVMLLHGEDFLNLYIFSLDIISFILKTDSNKVYLHPDFYHLHPNEEISVNKISEFIYNLNKSTYESSYKVALILEVDKLHPNAASLLSRVLENPPINTYIILFTIRPYFLLEVISKRCINVYVPSNVNTLQMPNTLLKWFVDYKSLLNDIYCIDNNITHIFMKMYGLLYKLNELIDNLDKCFIENDFLNYFNKKVSINTYSIWNFLSEIEVQTYKFFKNKTSNLKLISTIEALENIIFLLKFNTKINTLLETFLLKLILIYKGV